MVTAAAGTKAKGVAAVVPCPWVLAGPWYRWSKPGDPAAGRLSRPVFQKYETSNFVTDFLANPQHSLKFVDEDFVYQPVSQPAPLFHGRRTKLSDYVLVKQDIRKLFLAAHKRFYLVVCELHCDVAGFPSGCRDEVCETGFVVRRRIAEIPLSAEKTTAVELQKMAQAQAMIAQFNELLPGQKSAMVEAAQQGYLKQYAEAEANFKVMAQAAGVKLTLQGWIPKESDRVGEWASVEETPQKITERLFPLYPLVPDPALKKHAGKDRAIYFGVLPTTSADSDAMGFAHLDDQSLYEVRCFVRRHDPLCPKKQVRGDCRGEIVWSRRTESYRLASHFDLTGTSNRPVTIQLPDLRALEAETAALAPGRGAPVKMVAPPKSNLSFKVDTSSLTATKTGDPTAAICSFSIPLITIVANFVFRLFLPVVTFLFGLFFLLKLRFCIPPTVSVSADVAASLNATAEFDLNASLQAKLETDIKTAFEAAEGAKIIAQYSPSAQASLSAPQAANFSGDLAAGIETDPANPNAPQGNLTPVTAGLEYEQEVAIP